MDYYNRIADTLLINSLVSCWNIESDEFLACVIKLIRITRSNSVGTDALTSWNDISGGGEGEKES